MKRLLRLVALALSCAPLLAQTTVTPILQPHVTFVDASGSPCAGCQLYSYVAGTTTPQPTWTDSTGVSQNPNPIILDAAGGAEIWMGTNLTYKFVLVSYLGTTIWSVDNVKGSSGGGGALSTCSYPYAITFANSAATGLACDSTITIDPSMHAILVGGHIVGPSFTLRNQATITSSWTLDVTSPGTALNSFGQIPLANLHTGAADTVVMNATGGTASPTAVALPAGCTNGVNYSTISHTWTCSAGSVSLSNLATQAADTVVMNATASVTSPTAVALPVGCANGVNYSTSSHGWTCVPAYNPADHDATLSRAFGTSYQNTASGPMRIYGYGNTAGSSVGSVEVRIGATTATTTTYVNTCAATVSGGACGFAGEVPAGWFYTVVANTKTGGASGVSGVGGWHEVY